MVLPTGRLSPALPFAAAGAVCITGGGLMSAATAYAPSEASSWAVAYLVLVAGVAQIGLGCGQALLARQILSSRLVATEFTSWNAGNAAVLTGTLLGIVPVIDIGGLLLVLALALVAYGVRGSAKAGPAARGTQHRYAHSRALLGTFRLLVVVLLVSIPIGLVLART